MYIVNEVSEVNTKYIFFKFSDGTQDRKKINKNDLKELYKDVCEMVNNYEFMIQECKIVYNSINVECEKLEENIKGYEKFIENNQNNNMVLRGLHNVCSSLEWENKKQREMFYNRSGVLQTIQYARTKYDKLKRLQNDIESVLRVL